MNEETDQQEQHDQEQEETGEEEVDEEEPLNPDIDRPSPPRAGAPRLFENPFDLTDEDSKPVEPEKQLSPSHVFESTSLEQSLLQIQTSEGSSLDGQGSTGNFVIRKSSSSSSSIRSSSSNKSTTPSSSKVTTTTSVGLEEAEDAIKLGQEANDLESDEEEHGDGKDNPEEEEIAMDMDYDNLMAYFDNLKESMA